MANTEAEWLMVTVIGNRSARFLIIFYISFNDFNFFFYYSLILFSVYIILFSADTYFNGNLSAIVFVGEKKY